MKKLISLSLLTFLFTISTFSQDNFVWDEVIPVEGTKDELFSKAKMVLAQDFNNSEHVTHNSDREAGILLVKAQTTSSIPFSMGQYFKYYFEYELTILIKDNKYRLLIKNVHTVKAIYSYDKRNYAQRASLPVESKYPAASKKEGKKKFAITPDRYFELMIPLRASLQDIFNLIKADLQKESVINEDW